MTPPTLPGLVKRCLGAPRGAALAALLLALTSPIGAGEPVVPPPDADFFPLVRGSAWIYATVPPRGDIVVDALRTEQTACRDPRTCQHDHGHETEADPNHAHEAGEATTGADLHTYFVLSLSLVSRDRAGQPIRLQREWMRRDEAGDLRCARRTLNQEEIFLDPPQLILPSDPRRLKEWAWAGTFGFDTAKMACAVEAEETVAVPAGTFKTLRVRVRTETVRGKGRATRWYAPGVGLVKEETEIDVKGGTPVRSAIALKSYRIGPHREGAAEKGKEE